MRRTSSFASAWPRTSSSLTPQFGVARLEAADLRDAHQHHRAHEDQEVEEEEDRELHEQGDGTAGPWRSGRRRRPCRRRSSRGPYGRRRSARRTRSIVIRRTIASARRYFRRQYQARRRLRTSSSRSCVSSVANRLGHGMNRRRRCRARRGTRTRRPQWRQIAQPRLSPCAARPEEGGRRRDDCDERRRPSQRAPLAAQRQVVLGSGEERLLRGFVRAAHLGSVDAHFRGRVSLSGMHAHDHGGSRSAAAGRRARADRGADGGRARRRRSWPARWPCSPTPGT